MALRKGIPISAKRYTKRIPSPLLRNLPKFIYYPDTYRRIGTLYWKKERDSNMIKRNIFELARDGHFTSVRQLVEKFCIFLPDLARVAIVMGDLEFLKWMHFVQMLVRPTQDDEEFMIYEHWDVIEWMHEIFPPRVGFPSCAFEFIAYSSREGFSRYHEKIVRREGWLAKYCGLLTAARTGVSDHEFICEWIGIKGYSHWDLYQYIASVQMERELDSFPYWKKVLREVVQRMTEPCSIQYITDGYNAYPRPIPEPQEIIQALLEMGVPRYDP